MLYREMMSLFVGAQRVADPPYTYGYIASALRAPSLMAVSDGVPYKSMLCHSLYWAVCSKYPILGDSLDDFQWEVTVCNAK